jgi:hypothetical protein
LNTYKILKPYFKKDFTITREHETILFMSNTEKRQNIAAFDREKSMVLSVAEEFLEGRVEHGEMVEHLAEFGSYGAYITGELQIDDAMLRDPEIGDRMFSEALESLENALHLGKSEDQIRRVRSLPNVEFRLSQLPVLRSMAVYRELPVYDVAKDHYSGLLSFASMLIELNTGRNRGGSSSNRLMLNHLMDVTAVSLLYVRAGIRENSTDEIFTIQPGFSDVTGGSPKFRHSPSSFDLVTYEMSEMTGQPIVIDSVKVVTELNPEKQIEIDNDIKLVVVNRDLKLSSRDYVPVLGTIKACLDEYCRDGGLFQVIDPELDQREEQLLTITA